MFIVKRRNNNAVRDDFENASKNKLFQDDGIEDVQNAEGGKEYPTDLVKKFRLKVGAGVVNTKVAFENNSQNVFGDPFNTSGSYTDSSANINLGFENRYTTGYKNPEGLWLVKLDTSIPLFGGGDIRDFAGSATEFSIQFGQEKSDTDSRVRSWSVGPQISSSGYSTFGDYLPSNVDREIYRASYPSVGLTGMLEVNATPNKENPLLLRAGGSAGYIFGKEQFSDRWQTRLERSPGLSLNASVEVEKELSGAISVFANVEGVKTFGSNFEARDVATNQLSYADNGMSLGAINLGLKANIVNHTR